MVRPVPAKWEDAAACPAEPLVVPAFPDVPSSVASHPELVGPVEPMVETPQPVRDNPRAARAVPTPTIDYVPLGLYFLFSVCSGGLYPYLWLLNRIDGFEAAGVTGLDRSGIGRYCALGICAQLLLLASGVIGLWGWLASVHEWYASAFLVLVAYGVAFVFVVLPLRCFYHFDIRWRLRRVASWWDENGLMIARTAPSLFFLFLFGTAYLQWHVNRLIGLGMPGFTGYDDVGIDAAIGDVIKEYVQGATRHE